MQHLEHIYTKKNYSLFIWNSDLTGYPLFLFAKSLGWCDWSRVKKQEGVLWVESCPPVEDILKPSPSGLQNVTLFVNRAIADIIVEMRIY